MTTNQPLNPSFIDEVNNTSIELWYSNVANAMKKAEVMPGTYFPNLKAADDGTVVLRERERGAVTMKAHTNGMISLENTNIYFQQKLNVKIPGRGASYISEYYIGYRDVAGIISSYVIWSNLDPIQTKTNCDYEWMLANMSKLEAAMKNNDNDALLKKIRSRNPNVPGIYIDLKDIPAAGITHEVILNLKVPVTKFLILNDLKWIADWMGTWTIEMWPSMKNIVVAPVIPEALFTKFPKIQEAMDEFNNADAGTTDTANILVDFGFHHLNQNMRNRFSINETAGADYGKVTILAPEKWECDNHETIIQGIHPHLFTLRSELANALREEYLRGPLLLPMRVVEYKNFTSQLVNNENPKPTVDLSLLHTKAAYIFFREDALVSTQRFVNPFARYQLNIGGGHYPPVAFSTVDDLRSVNQTLDAMDYNNSMLGSITDDLATSMQPYVKTTKYNTTKSEMEKTFRWSTGDRSCYTAGFTFSDSGIFQGGLSCKGTAELNIERLKNPDVPAKCSKIKFVAPVIVTVQERILAVYAARPENSPQVQILNSRFDELVP